MFLETALQLAELLDLAEVPAHLVQIGDVVVHQGSVVLVRSIEPLEFPPGNVQFLKFASEPTWDGYLREVTAKPEATVKRIPRVFLKEPNDAA